MKDLVRSAFRKFGLDVVRYVPPAERKSKRSSALTYVKTTTGNYYLPTEARGDLIANAIKQGRIFDEEILRVAGRYIKPGTVVLDVGANFGQMSILFSNLAGENGKIYSFDADDFVFEILKKNIEANGRENRIVPVFGAVHDTRDLTFHFPVQDFERFDTYGSYGIDYTAKVGREVSSITIDSLEIAEPISFMKVDVQGGDLQAMRGARKTIEKNRMPIIFEYEYQFEDELKLSFEEYIKFVHSIGYRFEKVINGYNYLIVPRD